MLFSLTVATSMNRTAKRSRWLQEHSTIDSLSTDIDLLQLPVLQAKGLALKEIILYSHIDLLLEQQTQNQ